MRSDKRKRRILIGVFIFVIILIIFVCGLNKTLSFFNKYANLLLVIITGIYAFYTHRMVSIMGRQTNSDIQVSSIKLKSSFNVVKNGESNFDKILIHDAEKLSSENLDFYISFDIYNRSSCSGSISKPKLIIKVNGFNYEIQPKTKFFEDKYSGGQYIGEVENDLGATIYLRGGEYKNVELEYHTNLVNKEFTKHFIESMQNSKVKKADVKYFLKYKNNLGKLFEKSPHRIR